MPAKCKNNAVKVLLIFLFFTFILSLSACDLRNIVSVQSEGEVVYKFVGTGDKTTNFFDYKGDEIRWFYEGEKGILVELEKEDPGVIESKEIILPEDGRRGNIPYHQEGKYRLKVEAEDSWSIEVLKFD